MKRVYKYFAFAVLYASQALGVEFSYTKDAPHNFGVVVNNEHHTIYRSEGLGKKGLETISDYLDSNGLPFPQTLIHMNKQGYKRSFPFFQLFAVEEYELQDTYGYEYFHSFRYDQRTYVDGDNPYKPKKDIDGAGNLGEEAQEYFVEIRDNKVDGGLDAFMRVLNIVLDAKGPVLFHCTGGRHRTGMVAMALRYLQGGEWLTGKEREVTPFPFGPKMLLNPAQYEYYLHNKAMFRVDNIKFIEKFQHDPQFLVLKAKYGASLNH